jgi:hypothetical protein
MNERTDRTVELLLATCREAGALQLFTLWTELHLLADNRAFTTAEVCAHALLRHNARLRVAIEAVCGEVSPRKLGKQLSKWDGKNIAGLSISYDRDDAAGILWLVTASKPISAREMQLLGNY